MLEGVWRLEQLEALYLNTAACHVQSMPRTEQLQRTSGINTSLLLHEPSCDRTYEPQIVHLITRMAILVQRSPDSKSVTLASPNYLQWYGHVRYEIRDGVCTFRVSHYA